MIVYFSGLSAGGRTLDGHHLDARYGETVTRGEEHRMVNNNLQGPDQSQIERRVEEIWRDVLGMDPWQDNATFLEMAGQSISAIRIASRIEDEFGVPVDISELFHDHDMKTFARIIAERAIDVAAKQSVKQQVENKQMA